MCTPAFPYRNNFQKWCFGRVCMSGSKTLLLEDTLPKHYFWKILFQNTTFGTTTFQNTTYGTNPSKIFFFHVHSIGNTLPQKHFCFQNTTFGSLKYSSSIFTFMVHASITAISASKTPLLEDTLPKHHFWKSFLQRKARVHMLKLNQSDITFTAHAHTQPIRYLLHCTCSVTITI